MQLDLSQAVLAPNGDPYTNSKGEPDTLLNICKVIVSSPLEDDPKNVEHFNKASKILQKLDSATDGQCILKPSTCDWIKDRMIRGRLPLQVTMAFSKLYEGVATQAQLDEV